MLAGSGARAEKEVAEAKHIAVILSGQRGYESLSESDRRTLAEQIRALDAASTVSLEAPASVTAGATFTASVSVTGGAGPVVGVMLVDRAHRWLARPAASAGWQVAAPPAISAGDGAAQQEWLGGRPPEAGRNLSYVNVTGIESDSAARRWARARVVFTLRAPSAPGSYPLAAAFLYGTEKSTVLGYTTDPLGVVKVRGGAAGGSGRVLFTPVQQVQVQPAAAPPAPAPAQAPAPAPAPTPTQAPTPAPAPSGQR
jgi:hypothetical protein